MTYVIALPERLPSELFDNVDVQDFQKAGLRDSYARVPRMGVSDAENPREAVSNLIFRAGLQTVRAKTLNAMFKPVSRKYAFEVPEKPKYDADNKHLESRFAEVFQDMVLAEDIAHERDGSAGDYYPLAVRLMQLYRTSRRAIPEH